MTSGLNRHVPLLPLRNMKGEDMPENVMRRRTTTFLRILYKRALQDLGKEYEIWDDSPYVACELLDVLCAAVRKRPDALKEIRSDLKRMLGDIAAGDYLDSGWQAQREFDEYQKAGGKSH